MDLIFIGLLVVTGGIAFVLGMGVGGVVVAQRAHAHTAAFLAQDDEKDARG
ncbi:hypothetical protein [Sphingobium cupriresistens]|uniref:hypothetical protein n=1 Tax=Sphingobium cupriresistens TaxID=1132417 RepID=UPI003BF5929C